MGKITNKIKNKNLNNLDVEACDPTSVVNKFLYLEPELKLLFWLVNMNHSLKTLFYIIYKI